MEKIFDISFNMPNPNIDKLVASYFDDIPNAVDGVQEFFREMHFTNSRHIKKVLNKYILIRYYQERKLDTDGLIPDQNIDFFRYLTLFVIILYSFEIDQYNFLKNYDTKISGIKSLLTVEPSASNQQKPTTNDIQNNMYTNIKMDDKKYILDAVYGKTIQQIIMEVTKRGLFFDNINLECLKVLITIFAPNIDAYKPFNYADDYIQQFYKPNNILSYWCRYIFSKYRGNNFNNKDLLDLMSNKQYCIWNIFDMAERYL